MPVPSQTLGPILTELALLWIFVQSDLPEAPYRWCPLAQRPAARSFLPLAEAASAVMASIASIEYGQHDHKIKGTLIIIDILLGITWRLWASLSIMPCCQALGQSWCLSKAPGSYCLCQRPAWGSISNGVKTGFDATMVWTSFQAWRCSSWIWVRYSSSCKIYAIYALGDFWKHPAQITVHWLNAFIKWNCLRLDATWQGKDHQDSDPLHFYVHSKAEILQMQLQMNLKDRHEIYNMHILSQYAIYIYIYIYAMSLCHA